MQNVFTIHWRPPQLVSEMFSKIIITLLIALLENDIVHDIKFVLRFRLFLMAFPVHKVLGDRVNKN